MIRRTQSASSTPKDNEDIHDSELNNFAGHNRSDANDAKDTRHRTKHFMIGITVLCLLLFSCFHFFINEAARNHSIFSIIGHEDNVDDRNEILPTCWGKNNRIATEHWHSTLKRISRNTNDVKNHNSHLIISDYDRNKSWNIAGKSMILNNSIRSDFRNFYDVSSFYPEKNVPIIIKNYENGNDSHNQNKSGPLQKKNSNDNIHNHNKNDNNDNNNNNNNNNDNNNNNNDHNGNNNNNINIANQNNQNQMKFLDYCDSIVPDAGVCVKESSSLGFRCLPSFMIIGTMKSGTGELMTWLNRHPNLQSGKRKNKVTGKL